MLGSAGRGSDQFMLRLPDGMRDRIRYAAEAAGRSMNAEIVGTLEKAYPGRSEIEEVMAEIVFKIELLKLETDPDDIDKLVKELDKLNSSLQYFLNDIMHGYHQPHDAEFQRNM